MRTVAQPQTARVRNLQLSNPKELEKALEADRFLLLKHSERCGIGRHAFGEYETFVAKHPEVPTGWVEVRESRRLSNRIETATSVAHASPQAIWIVDGEPAWSASHFDITNAALSETLDVAGVTPTSSARV